MRARYKRDRQTLLSHYPYKVIQGSERWSPIVSSAAGPGICFSTGVILIAPGSAHIGLIASLTWRSPRIHSFQSGRWGVTIRVPINKTIEAAAPKGQSRAVR